MSLPRYAFFQGRVVPYSEARVGVLTHGLNYGTGVFSGIRGYWNADEHELFVFRPDDHPAALLGIHGADESRQVRWLVAAPETDLRRDLPRKRYGSGR